MQESDLKLCQFAALATYYHLKSARYKRYKDDAEKNKDYLLANNAKLKMEMHQLFYEQIAEILNNGNANILLKEQPNN